MLIALWMLMQLAAQEVPVPVDMPPPVVAPLPEPVRPPVALAGWRVVARMKMQADGLIESCTMETSGEPPSDAATVCERNKGKRNALLVDSLKGQPGTALFELVTTIDGEPARSPAEEPGYELLQAFRIHFDVGETGHAENCRDLPPVRTGSATLEQSSPCLIPFGPFVPVVGPDGKPRRSGATLDVSLALKPLRQTDPDGPGGR